MDVGFTGAAPMCIVDEACNFEGVEIIVDSSSSNSDSLSQDVLSNEGYGENMVYSVLNTHFEEEDSSDKPGTSANSGPSIHNPNDDVQVYLPTGVLLHSVAVPNNKITFALQNNENGTVYEVYPINKDTLSTFQSSLLDENKTPGSAYFPYLHASYDKNPFNNDHQYLDFVYATPEIVDPYSPDYPEYIDINHIVPKSNNAVLSDLTNTTNTVVNLSSDNQDDDEVIFIKEYKNVNSSANKPDTSSDENTAPASSPLKATFTVRRRKRRKTFGEKRKNPVRKAQIDKASADLIEKLSIPSSVFNARVKKKVLPTNGIQKNLRQSCRTTGAILSPPSPLGQSDFKEWPTEGMHERPIYNQQTGTVRKHDYGPTTTPKRQKKNNMTSPLASTSSGDNINQPRGRGHRRSFEEKQNSETFIRLTHERFHMMLSYAEEVNEFNKLIAANAECKSELVPKTLYEKSVEFHHAQFSPKTTTKDKMMAKKFAKMVQGKKASNILNVANMLADTCTLYSLANGVSEKAIAKYITSLSVSEGKNWLKKQL